jgi:hypothetical protein
VVYERPGTRQAPATRAWSSLSQSRPQAGRAGKHWPRPRRKHRTRLPDHGDALRIAGFLDSYPGWSAFWDKRDGVWRVAEDDPRSDLYTEDAQAGGVIDYIVTHS